MAALRQAVPGIAVLAVLAGCAQLRLPGRPPPREPLPATRPAQPAPAASAPAAAEARPAPATQATGRVVSFADLPGWADDRHAEALAVFLNGCKAIKPDKPLAAACAAARSVLAGDDAAARAFWEARFEPVELSNGNGGSEGLVTGYYEPEIRACRARKPDCSVPVHGVPDDLISVDLVAIDPDLKGKRLRGRLDGRRLVPYASRAEIDARSAAAKLASNGGGTGNGSGNGNGTANGKLLSAPLPAPVLAWAADPVDLFFMQVQGSGRLQLDDGSVLRLGYADQNGHPYRAVGKSLVERGALSRDGVSMQSIRAWLAANPAERDAVLATNPSYVFFRELPPSEDGPPGSLGVPLTPARSIAVDVNAVPLGSPVWLATTDPDDGSAIRRLMAAQDTGGAIRGSVRADLFWGRGEVAAAKAGRMQQPGRMWVLRPRQ
ncbi:MAG: transglycosylase [Rhodocyclaceae bacterium]|nr:transglycosylase [Rhodocyclaceae bacterium]